MKTFILFTALTLASGFAMAEGGKHRGSTSSSPLYDIDGDQVGEVIELPAGCVTTPPQAADDDQSVLFVYCTD